MKLLDNNWVDLYELLGVESGVDEQTLLERLYEYEARGKSHLHKKIVAQYRRILLDPECRNLYDQNRARHKSGDPAAIEFSIFLSVIRQDDFQRHLSTAKPQRVVRRPSFAGARPRAPQTTATLRPVFSPTPTISTDLRRRLATAPQPKAALTLVSGAPALSRTSVDLLTGIVATLLISYIQSGTHVLPGL